MDLVCLDLELANVSMFLANAFKPDPRVRREALTLIEAGNRVTVFAWDRECKYPAEEVIDGIKVVRFRIAAPFGSFLPLLPGFIRFYVNLLRACMRDSPDVIHCHDMDTLKPGVLVSRLKGTKLVYDVHESYPDFISTFAPAVLVRVLRFVEPCLIRRADLVVTTSSMISEIAERAGAKKVIAVMNCFDPFPDYRDEAERIRRALLSEGEFLIVYIGGLFAGRGLEEVIEAVSMVEGTRLFMGGYGPLEPELKRLARSLGAGDRVTFAGEIEPSMVPKYDAAADLLFAMYKSDDPNNVLTIPNKLFESIAAAKPILVSDLGEKSELVSNEGNGMVVDPEDVGSIARAISLLKEDRDTYQRMSDASRRSQARYNWAKMADKLVNAYSGLLGPA